jgi:hypothetical protein
MEEWQNFEFPTVNVPFTLHLEKYVHFLHPHYFEFNVCKVKSGVAVLAEV